MNSLSFPATLPASSIDPQLSTASLRSGNSKELAAEFESLFVSMLLKQMRQSASMEGEGSGLFPGDSSDTYGGIFDMTLGRHIAQSGGIGLADSIEKSMS